jgi:hypothetical protein
MDQWRRCKINLLVIDLCNLAKRLDCGAFTAAFHSALTVPT